jgi:hypothetical protein
MGSGGGRLSLCVKTHADAATTQEGLMVFWSDWVSSAMCSGQSHDSRRVRESPQGNDCKAGGDLSRELPKKIDRNNQDFSLRLKPVIILTILSHHNTVTPFMMTVD